MWFGFPTTHGVIGVSPCQIRVAVRSPEDRSGRHRRLPPRTAHAISIGNEIRRGGLHELAGSTVVDDHVSLRRVQPVQSTRLLSPGRWVGLGVWSPLRFAHVRAHSILPFRRQSAPGTGSGLVNHVGLRAPSGAELSHAASAAATASCSLQAAPAAIAVWHSSGLIARWRRSTSLLRIAMAMP